MADHSQTIWFESALLEAGWARNVRLTLSNGVIARVETDVARAKGEDAFGPVLPGLPNLHSHAFQRGMAGLAEAREDLEKNFRAALQSGLGKLDLVTREEFDVQRAVLLRTREKLDLLERMLVEMEARLDAAAPATRN